MHQTVTDVKLIFSLVVTSLLSLTSVNTHAQSKIFGLVTDIVGLPIADANVLLLNSKDSSLIKGSVSEKDGKYVFANISAGNYMVSSTFVGFKQVYTTPFNVGGNNQEINIPTIKFVAKETQLAEVKVTAKKPLFEQKIDRMVVNVANSITAAGSTALEVLERSPGIIVDHQNNTLSMNGKDGVVVMINGKINHMPLTAVVQMLSSMTADN